MDLGTKQLESCIEGLQIWCVNRKHLAVGEVFADFSDQIRRGSMDPYDDDSYGWPANLNWNGHFYLMHGAWHVLNGIADGWSRMALGMTWQFIGVWLPFRHQQHIAQREPGKRLRKRPFIGGMIVSAAHMLCHAVVNNRVSIADWLAQRLVDAARGMHTTADLPRQPFEVFSVWFAAHRLGVSYDSLREPLLRGYRQLAQRHGRRELMPSPGVYGELMQYWADDALIKTILMRVCDSHVESTKYPERNEDEIPEFTWSPYDIFPVEILAILKQREAEGLKNPSVDHPLMKTALADPPSNVTVANDEDLDVLITRIKQQYQDIEQYL
ncbi:MAG: hypothetical protein IT445_14760 [Phycisphaeraceae bacterium]|nr:hypothetical protein [Phycisphaeraceae bacterium]